jgi:hypothetical protein
MFPRIRAFSGEVKTGSRQENASNENPEHRMTDLTSVTSSAAAFVSQQTTALTKAAGSATTSFAATLSKVQTTIVGRPKTGFTAGPTYEAGTLTGQTKAAFNNTINATKSVFGIKP